MEISKAPELSKQFSQSNIAAIGKGNAPTGSSAGFYQGPNRLVKKFTIHHNKPIEEGGGVYDIDNLRITSHKQHKFIHYGK